MQLDFDLDVGALYIRLSDETVFETCEAGDNAAVDLDVAGSVVGIEVISVAHRWPMEQILSDYKIPDAEMAQITSYFSLWNPRSTSVDSASPAPAALLAKAVA